MDTILLLWLLNGNVVSMETFHYASNAACLTKLDEQKNKNENFITGVCVEGYSLPVKKKVTK
jgi:hypothetical protein